MLFPARNFRSCVPARGCFQHKVFYKWERSLLYPCFKTALCYGVVSGCFVHGVSPSSGSGRISLQNATWEAQSWLLERPKVRAKSMQNLLGHSAAWQGRSLEVRLPLIRCSVSELLQTAGETAAETELLRPETHILPSQERLHRNFDKNRKLRSFLVKTPQRLHKDTMTPQRLERFQKHSTG